MKRLWIALLLALTCGVAAAAENGIGAIVMHGKWGQPDRVIDGLAHALEREGYLVSSPEMPWSRRRLYDRTVEQADAEIDAEIAKLKARGAKQIVLVGHSLGAAYAVHYAGRTDLDAVVAVAPGHRPEAPRFAQQYVDDVKRSRELVAAGKGSETISFTDLNTGNRRDRLTATAASFVSYFDPEGPMNLGRNVAAVKATTPVLWLVPTREEAPLRQGGLLVYMSLPQNPRNRMAEPDSDHMGAPKASQGVVLEWLKKTLSQKPN
jgi:pimeloyl-ACP methyl ester carboxylesterase